MIKYGNHCMPKGVQPVMRPRRVPRRKTMQYQDLPLRPRVEKPHPSLSVMTDGQIWDAAYDDTGRRIVFRDEDRFTKRRRELENHAIEERLENERVARQIAEKNYHEDVWTQTEEYQ